MTTPEAVPPELLALAPADLPNRRTRRFDGSGFEVPLARFPAPDRDVLARLYRAVEGLAAVWRATHRDPDFPALERYVRGLDAARLRADAAAVGAGSPDPGVRAAAHDVRGGGLTFLLATAELLDLVPDGRPVLRQCAEVARDHAKIMRNLLPDIDPPVRAADEAARAHGIGHFVDKWAGARVRGDGGPVEVRVRCLFRGDISARCLETSSIDRVVYNYVNNAVRFAAGGRVEVWIFPVGGGDTRWVVRNRVAADQAGFLAAAAPDPRRLFAGGVTRGGTGVGLRNCAELVADCYGLDSAAAAVAGGHLGAAARGDEFLAWFHWPAYDPGTPPGST